MPSLPASSEVRHWSAAADTVFGACLGALIMATLDNGMSLLNVRDFMQDIVKGSILVAAVGLDMIGRKQS